MQPAGGKRRVGAFWTHQIWRCPALINSARSLTSSAVGVAGDRT